MKYAIIDNTTNLVENVIEAVSPLSMAGKTLIQSNTANIGDSYDGTNIIAPTKTAAELATEASQLLISQAKYELIKSDITTSRLTQAVALGLNTFTSADSVAYVTYISNLRKVVQGTLTTMPVKPPYPAGT